MVDGSTRAERPASELIGKAYPARTPAKAVVLVVSLEPQSASKHNGLRVDYPNWGFSCVWGTDIFEVKFAKTVKSAI